LMKPEGSETVMKRILAHQEVKDLWLKAGKFEPGDRLTRDDFVTRMKAFKHMPYLEKTRTWMEKITRVGAYSMIEPETHFFRKMDEFIPVLCYRMALAYDMEEESPETCAQIWDSLGFSLGNRYDAHKQDGFAELLAKQTQAEIRRGRAEYPGTFARMEVTRLDTRGECNKIKFPAFTRNECRIASINLHCELIAKDKNENAFCWFRLANIIGESWEPARGRIICEEIQEGIQKRGETEEKLTEGDQLLFGLIRIVSKSIVRKNTRDEETRKRKHWFGVGKQGDEEEKKSQLNPDDPVLEHLKLILTELALDEDYQHKHRKQLERKEQATKEQYEKLKLRCKEAAKDAETKRRKKAVEIAKKQSDQATKDFKECLKLDKEIREMDPKVMKNRIKRALGHVQSICYHMALCAKGKWLNPDGNQSWKAQAWNHLYTYGIIGRDVAAEHLRLDDKIAKYFESGIPPERLEGEDFKILLETLWKNSYGKDNYGKHCFDISKMAQMPLRLAFQVKQLECMVSQIEFLTKEEVSQKWYDLSRALDHQPATETDSFYEEEQENLLNTVSSVDFYENAKNKKMDKKACLVRCVELDEGHPNAWRELATLHGAWNSNRTQHWDVLYCMERSNVNINKHTV